MSLSTLRGAVEWSTMHPVPAALVAVLALALVAVLVWTATRAVRAARRLPAEVRVAALGAAVCTAYSGDTSWRFARDHLGMADLTERIIMFGAGEGALLACATMARANKQATATKDTAGSAGVAGALVWCITAVQIVPAFVESGWVGGIVRATFGPVMAGLLWHLAMGLEIRIVRPGALSTGLLAVVGRELRERLLSYLGLAARDRTAEQITRDRAMARAVRLASRPKRGAWGRRRLANAVANAGVGNDGEQRHRLLQDLAALRNAEELATVPLPSPWSSTPVLAEPYPRTLHGLTVAQLQAMDPLDAVLRVHAAHPEAPPAGLASLCTEYGVPVSEARVRVALHAVPRPTAPRPAAAPAHPHLVPVPDSAEDPVPERFGYGSQIGGLHLDVETEATVRREFACAVPAALIPVLRTRTEEEARVPVGTSAGPARERSEASDADRPAARTRPGTDEVPGDDRVPDPSGTGEQETEDLIQRARLVDAEHRRTHRGQPAPIRVLKKQLRIGQAKAEIVRAALNLEGTKQ